MATTQLSRRGGVWWFTRAMPRDLRQGFGNSHVRRSLRTAELAVARRRAARMTVAVDEWAQVVRDAIGADPDQPDRALLSRLLDDALSMEEGAATAAKLRQRAADLRAATAELASVTATGDQIRETTARALPVVRGMADDIRAKAARLADLEARHAPSDAIAALRAEFVESMADMRDTVLGAHRERWSAESLTAWLPRYLEFKANKLKDSKHLDTLRPRIELFARTVGDLPVRDYERRHFE